jgi:hypothetical protein
MNIRALITKGGSKQFVIKCCKILWITNWQSNWVFKQKKENLLMKKRKNNKENGKQKTKCDDKIKTHAKQIWNHFYFEVVMLF